MGCICHSESVSPHSIAITLGLKMAEYNVSEAGGSVSVRVIKTGRSAVAVTVLFSTVDQTATGMLFYLTNNLCSYMVTCNHLSLVYSTK